jgi:CPA2 family monovalent cation:H+ antiporter-2
MHLDPAMASIVGALFLILALCVLLRFLNQPYVVAYLIAGALLAQIGEFSFVLAAVGISSHTITEYGYQLVISTIAVSLLFSPAWIMLMRRMLSLPAPRTRLSERS